MTFHENKMLRKDSFTAKEKIDHKVKSEEIKIADHTILHNFRMGSVGNMPDLKWLPNCDNKTDNPHRYKCLDLSSNIFGAFKEQIIAECGDKTFLLIIIFTVTWSNWHIDMARPKKETKLVEERKDQDEIENLDDKDEDNYKEVDGIDKQMEGGENTEEKAEDDHHHGRVYHKKNITINPARIYVTATIGTVFANIMSIGF